MQAISNIYRAAAAARRRAERNHMQSDLRRVTVALTPVGLKTIEQLFPQFNEFEGKMSGGLSVAEKHELARLLRAVTTNASE